MMQESETLVTWYLMESWGQWGHVATNSYRERLRAGQRIGQAFFNSLKNEDQMKLIGTTRDPFYGGQADVYEALDFLTKKVRHGG